MSKEKRNIPEELPVIPMVPSMIVAFPQMPVYVKTLLDDESARQITELGYVIIMNRPLKLDDMNRTYIGLIAKVVEVNPIEAGFRAVIANGVSRCKIIFGQDPRPEKIAQGKEIVRWQKLKETPINEGTWESPEFIEKIAKLTILTQETIKVISSSPNFTDDMFMLFENAVLFLNNCERKDFGEALDKMTLLFNTVAYMFSTELLLDLFEDAFVNSRFEKTLALSEIILKKIREITGVQKGGVAMPRGRGSREQNPYEKKHAEIRDGLTQEVNDAIENELTRLSRMNLYSAEAGVIQTYLDWLLNYPWNKFTVDNLDLARARAILKEDHYGLEDAKERIIEFLAARKLNPKKKGDILLFTGPPGVGKTSLGRSIARALGRKFIRISLSGIRDEAEIRGHRRTYIGALPGKIIQENRACGYSNAVFMLDEIDKVAGESGHEGNPGAALIEVLDPEQNHSFKDHYMGVSINLSQILFIGTANNPDLIDEKLRNRMEEIEFRGYSEEEKIHIANEFVIGKQLLEHGLNPEADIFKPENDPHFDPVLIKITDECLRTTINNYTMDSGMRDLEREIAKMIRKVGKKIIDNDSVIQPESERSGVAPSDINIWEINEGNLESYLGDNEELHEKLQLREVLKPGVVPMMGVVKDIGTIIYINALCRKNVGHREIRVTCIDPHNQGVGKMLKESAHKSWDYLFNEGGLLIDYGIPENTYLHISVLNGGMPKDGPSAGVVILWAIYGLFTKQSLKPWLTGTGDVSLEGLIGKVGGVPEKIIGADRWGAREIVIPLTNERNLKNVPDRVKERVRIITCDSMDKALKIGFPNCPILARKLAHIQVD